MSLYRPAKSLVWQYDFRFQGTRYRGTTNTKDRRVAVRIERAVRQKLELAAFGISGGQKGGGNEPIPIS